MPTDILRDQILHVTLAILLFYTDYNIKVALYNPSKVTDIDTALARRNNATPYKR